MTIKGGSYATIPFTAKEIKRIIPPNTKIALDTEWVSFDKKGQVINTNRYKAYAQWKKTGDKNPFKYTCHWPRTKKPDNWDKLPKNSKLLCIVSIALSEDEVYVLRAHGSGLKYNNKDQEQAVDALRELNPTIYVWGGYIERQLLKDCNIIDLQPTINGNQQGLKAAIKEHFDVTIPKEEQCSNWYVIPLTPKQYEYASMDAVWVWKILLNKNE